MSPWPVYTLTQGLGAHMRGTPRKPQARKNLLARIATGRCCVGVGVCRQPVRQARPTASVDGKPGSGYDGNAMRQAIVIALAIPLAVIVTALVAHAVTPGETVYGVGQVVAGIRQDPRAWIGHTIQVRGAIIALAWVHPQSGLSGWDCGDSTSPCLLDPARGFGSVHALLVPGPVPIHPNTSPMADAIYPDWAAGRYHVALVLAVPKSPANQTLAFLQRMPLLRALLPAEPGTLHGNVSEVVRVRVLAPSRAPCGPFPALCRDDAVLLGAP